MIFFHNVSVLYHQFNTGSLKNVPMVTNSAKLFYVTSCDS